MHELISHLTNTPRCQTQTLHTRLLRNLTLEMYQPAAIMLNVSNMEQPEKTSPKHDEAIC